MKMRIASVLAAVAILSCNAAFAIEPIAGNSPGADPQQSILNSRPDDLLKNFDVDPASLKQYDRKPLAATLLGHLTDLLPKVDVKKDGGKASLHVKAPFINLALGGEHRLVSVKAPFVKVDAGNALSVQTPLTDFNLGGPSKAQPLDNKLSGATGGAGLNTMDNAPMPSTPADRLPGANTPQASDSDWRINPNAQAAQ